MRRGLSGALELLVRQREEVVRFRRITTRSITLNTTVEIRVAVSAIALLGVSTEYLDGECCLVFCQCMGRYSEVRARMWLVRYRILAAYCTVEAVQSVPVQAMSLPKRFHSICLGGRWQPLWCSARSARFPR